MRRAIVIAAAAVAALVPVPRGVIERSYANGFYIAIQPAVTAASNRTAVALLDVLIAIALASVIVRVLVTVSRARAVGWLRAAGGLAVSLAAAASAFYLAFLLLWGWNYQRLPLSQKLEYVPAQVTRQAATAAARDSIAALNRLHAPAHAAGWTTTAAIDPELASAFAEVQRALGAQRLAIPARPKTTLLDAYFRRTGVSGMTDPYFLETLVDDTLLPFERPFVVAHEWAHLAGYADEGEANFVGWLTCVRAREPEQYSGWLFLYEELAQSVPARDRAALRSTVDEGVRKDYEGISARLQHNINPTLALAGWRVYDQYLKVNRIPEGAASYDTVVRLVLGVKFGTGWTPMVKPR